jgi:L,D-transpeptidase YcbB
MDLNGWNRLAVLLSKGAALATLIAGATSAAAEAPPVEGAPTSVAPRVIVSPEAPPVFGAMFPLPLIDVFNAQQASAAPPDLGPFARLAPADLSSAIVASVAAKRDVVEAPSLSSQAPEASTAFEALPQPFPTRSASPVPARVPTAIAAAIDRLIVDNSHSPLGAGDWRAARAAIGAFYAGRDFEPVWVGAAGLTSAGRTALGRLRLVSEDGLNLSEAPPPKTVPADLAPDDLAEAETRIAVAVVAYAEQASGSRIAPSRISPLISAAPTVADPGAALAETAAAPDPGERLAEFNPPQKAYRELREELRRVRELASAPRKDALDINVDLGEAPFSDDALPVAEPYRLSRQRGTRRARGYTASATHALRSSQARRIAAIVANMEMWRWEPRDMGERRIEINIPDFSITVFDGDTAIHSARVVVGKPKTPTPVFSNVMRYVLINPSWLVPDSIVRKEILPRLSHFEALGYEFKTVGGRLVVRQPPGDDNALGRLAFMFPNDYSVYLHDTPARELFSEDMRALSHGCVRVEAPLRLAKLLLGWPEARISAAIGGRERTVFLPRPVPIHIEYFTDFVDDDGVLQERPDVYGLTQKVAGTLSAISQD